MNETATEKKDHKFRLLIKRPSWGYSKLERELMSDEQRFQRIANPMHEAGFYVGGMFMQIEAPNSTAESFVFKPRLKSSALTMLSSTALATMVAAPLLKPLCSTLLTYPGKVYAVNEPIHYDDVLEYDITKEQHEAIRAELQYDMNRTTAYNYIVRDSGLYALRLAEKYGVDVPSPSKLIPLEMYRFGGQYEHRIRLQSMFLPDDEILTLIPRNIAGIGQDEKHRRVISFEEKLLEERLNRYRTSEGLGTPYF